MKLAATHKDLEPTKEEIADHIVEMTILHTMFFAL